MIIDSIKFLGHTSLDILSPIKIPIISLDVTLLLLISISRIFIFLLCISFNKLETAFVELTRIYKVIFRDFLLIFLSRLASATVTAAITKQPIIAP